MKILCNSSGDNIANSLIPGHPTGKQGRPVGARNAQLSTQRDPFAFELAKERRHRCGSCQGIEHNSRTCS
ncbi:36959_t:CDS:2, partial [Gigaspora margarita]